MFPFLIIGLFFAVISLFTGLLAMCTRIGSYISGFLAWLALTFQVITTCLMTYVSTDTLAVSLTMILTRIPVLSSSRAAMPSRATARPPSWVLRPSPSCGPPVPAFSSPVCAIASVVPPAEKILATVDARNAVVVSSHRPDPTACAAKRRRRRTLPLTLKCKECI